MLLESRKITAVGLVPLLLVAVLPPTAAAQSCQGWNTAKFFETATVDEVRACLSAGENPNEQDRQGLTPLHRAARYTSDPAVIEALMEAGADPRAYSIARRMPWYFARKNDKIKGSDVYERLRVASGKLGKLANKMDWSRVQAVLHDTKAAVQLYKDAAPAESRRIGGRFEAATADSITLRLKDGQTRTFKKSDVRKVLAWRPVGERKSVWIAIVVAAVLTEVGMWLADPPSALMRLMGHGIITLPVGVLTYYGTQLGPIYDVPRKHRGLPPGDQQSGDQDNASGKQHEAGRPSS